MRLFIAVEIPQNIKEKLIYIQKKLVFNGFRRVKDFHITLNFLGDIADSKVPELINKLNEIKFNGFKAKTQEIGAFPNLHNPRIIWMGVTPNYFIDLQKQVEVTVQEVGFSKEKRFHPHITLGRVRFLKNKQTFIKAVQEIKLAQSAFEVNSFELIKSTLTSNGPVYETLRCINANLYK